MRSQMRSQKKASSQTKPTALKQQKVKRTARRTITTIRRSTTTTPLKVQQQQVAITAPTPAASNTIAKRNFSISTKQPKLAQSTAAFPIDINTTALLTTSARSITTKINVGHKKQPLIQLPLTTTATRHMAMQKPKDGGKNSKDAKDKKKAGGFEVDPGEEALASAGDVKKNIRNWLEQIIQSKPEITPMPQAAIDNEELFVKECQARFAQRLDERTRFETAKIIIKQRAIAQLPGDLKTSSLKHDPTLWSMRVMTPFSDPPRKRWLLEHYGIPYKASQQEIDEEDFLKKKYARL